jgi:hypothetical protein
VIYIIIEHTFACNRKWASFENFIILKCENKFRMAGEDSGEAEFTPAQRSNEAVAPRCKENPQTLWLHQAKKG